MAVGYKRNSAYFSSMPVFPPVPVSSTPLFKLVENADAVICDFNGCVINDEEYQMRAFTELLNRETGTIHDFREIAKEMVSKSERQIISEFKSGYGLKGNIDVLLQKREDLYLHSMYFKNVEVNPDLMWTVHRAKAKDALTAILSNGREHIIRPLTYNHRINNDFDHVWTVDCKQRLAKPEYADKVCFLVDKADELGINLSKIILFEDSVNTIKKAEAQGVNCVRVDHWLAPNRNHTPKTGIVLNFPSCAFV